MTYDNTNSGALFKNTRKETDSHPDLTGKINIEGKDYWLSAWSQESREGKKFLKLSAKPVEARAPTMVAPQTADIDDEIPW
jgi:hypothetical protein